MSSYLNFYLIEKEGGKRLLLTSQCRSSEIYQHFVDNINIPYGEEPVEVKKEDIEQVLSSIKGALKNMRKAKDRNIQVKNEIGGFLADALSKLLKETDDEEKIRNVIRAFVREQTDKIYDDDDDQEEYIGDLEWAKQFYDFLLTLTYDFDYSSDFSGLACSID